MSETPSTRHPKLRSLMGGLLVAALTMVVMVATEPRLAIVWDEGFTLGREQRVRLWIEAMRDPPTFAEKWVPPLAVNELVQQDAIAPAPGQVDTRARLWSDPALKWFWPFAREEPHGHPPFYALVGLIGDVVVPSWEALPRARFGPMLVFSLTTGAIFAFFHRRKGVWPAALAAGAFALQPRLFGHGHYAHYDALLTCLWVGSILAFTKAVEDRARRWPRWGWVILFGVLAGCAADTKLTGWFLPLPFLAWSLLFLDRRAGTTLIVGGIVAIVVLYALTPPWWPSFIGGVDRFLRSNLTRGRTTRIPTLFLGQVYLTPAGSLPWYNTLVWTLFVTPAGFLAFSLVGAARNLVRARSEPIGLLPLGHWAFLLILRALPHTPGHDAERQFLAAFGCLALVAGWGASWVVERFGTWGKVLIGLALAEGAISIALMMPVVLSYFSPLVGGLPGATKLGMEPTYYWDALTPEAIDWLNAHTPPGGKVLFPTYPSSWRYLRRTGRLKVPVLPSDPGEWTWYVVQNRAGSLSPTDRDLVRRIGEKHVLVSKFGVPLVWAFPYDEYHRAYLRRLQQ